MFDPKIHHRQSIRFTGYDYSNPGYYFVTIVVQNRIPLFGTIKNQDVILNSAGLMIRDEWKNIPQRFHFVAIDKYVVMPDHFHGIIQINEQKNTTPVGKPLVGFQNDGPIDNAVFQNDGHIDNAGFQNDGHIDNVGFQNDGSMDNVGFQNDGPIDNAVFQNDGSMDNAGFQNDGSMDNVGFQNDGKILCPFDGDGTKRKPTRGFPTGSKPTLFDVVGAFKSITTNRYIDGVKHNNWPSFQNKLWQFQYYDRIIRNDGQLSATRNYIMGHPHT